MLEQPSTLTIIQYNVNKSRETQREFLEKAERAQPQPLVLAIQEPWKNTQQQEHTTLRTKSYYLLHGGSPHTRTCIYINKNLDINQWSVEHHSPDLITLSLHTGREDIQIHNIYNPKPNGIIAALPLLLNNNNAEHVLVGDMNLHHPSWGGIRVINTEEQAEELIRIITEAGMDLATEKGIETWARGTSWSTIDLTFTTGWLTERTTSCTVQEE
ncbi:DNase I-like protein [Mytilinidion resinicola]|uniref:DNase I-like protein n=1 Tax=Mytilinidion resinicola TaxID=574789 RepID=A0A6A6YXH5_9PEZI|nr:DNase I-like protein [Mytilinidion resinicola]KAF2812694.1 DNase I-like protein [Mytilinidion resinicola]